MNKKLLISLGHQIYADLDLAMALSESSDEPDRFGSAVILPLTYALEYVRAATSDEHKAHQNNYQPDTNELR